MDVLFSQKGAKQPGTNTFTQRINYLDIPLAFRYFLTTSGNFRPNIFVGPSFGFKLNAQAKNPNMAVSDNSQVFANSDIGLLAGFQLNWRAGNRQRFLIDTRYTYGMTDIYIGPNSANIDTHNSVFTVTVGYGFGIGRNY
ncbi:hypothetical protein GCM10023187_37850 [Nibrella viscosa]|uniref:Outer membrane protein beta-barrel domain-containing protein n=2 Tax=Nibrella viscosa TaxID=1084524 RepID=A0ABP8KP24_9BACT